MTNSEGWWCKECDGNGSVDGVEPRTCPVCNGDGKTPEARVVEGVIERAAVEMKRAQAKLESLNRELRCDPRSLDRARDLARAIESVAEDLRLVLIPECHNCCRDVPYGVECCGNCWHAGREDGVCELKTEEPREEAEAAQ